jgi:hypothetical protein
VLFTLILFSSASAQDKFQVRVVHDSRTDFGLSYNFFTGDGIDDFRTTIKGFGSGFLLDAFTGRMSTDILLIGTEDVNLTVGAGAAISKYRFSEPLVFFEENGEYTYSRDMDPDHSYGTGFFSNDKSKLVIGSFIFPVNLNFNLGKFYLSTGGSLDVFLSGKHKLKYTEDGDRRKEVIRNDQFNDFPINKLKWGLGAMLLHKPSGVSAGVTYMLTPFFKDESNFPEMREVRVSFSYDLSILSDKRKN